MKEYSLLIIKGDYISSDSVEAHSFSATKYGCYFFYDKSGNVIASYPIDRIIIKSINEI